MANSLTIERKRQAKSVANKRGKTANGPLTKAHPALGLGHPMGSMRPVADVRRMIGFSQPEFGRLTSYSTRAVADWESGKPMDARARRRIIEIERLLKALGELMPADQVGHWLRQRNEAFQGHSPLQLIEDGELDRLWQMIHQIDANVAN